MEPRVTTVAIYYGGKNEGPDAFAVGISLEQCTYALMVKSPESPMGVPQT